MWFWEDMPQVERDAVEVWVSMRYSDAVVTMPISSERDLWARFHAEWSRDRGPDYREDVWKAREHVLLARIRPPGSRRECL